MKYTDRKLVRGRFPPHIMMSPLGAVVSCTNPKIMRWSEILLKITVGFTGGMIHGRPDMIKATIPSRQYIAMVNNSLGQLHEPACFFSLSVNLKS